MKKHRTITVAAIAAAFTFTSSVLAGDCAASKDATASTCTPGKHILAIAASANNSKTLVAAVKAAGVKLKVSDEGVHGC